MTQLQKFTNNSSGTLNGDITSASTAITLVTGHGAVFPTLSGSEFFMATLKNVTSGALEIIKVTARSSDNLTVQRGQESTTPLDYPSGSIIELRPTAASFNNLYTEVGNYLDQRTGGTVTGDTQFTSTGALQISAGTTAQRPTGANGKIRWNSSLNQYEGYSTASSTWITLGGGAAAGANSDITSLSGLTGLVRFAKGASIASASTVNLSTAGGNTVAITGTTGITAWTMTTGQVMDVVFVGALILTHNATTNNLPGSANITTAAGDRARLYYDGTAVYVLSYTRADGQPVSSFGVGQTLTDVSGSRVVGVAYTNSTGKPIAVYISASVSTAANLIARIDGSDTLKAGTAGGINIPLTLMVPNGSTYQLVSDAGTVTVASWKEIR